MIDFSSMSDEELRSHHTHLVKETTRLNNLQMAMKIALNSAYGAIG